MNRTVPVLLVALVALVSCGEEEGLGLEPEHRYQAEVRYTKHGIPHIVAKDLRGVSFGQGYALAKAHACTLVDQIVKVRGERARYHGPGPDNAYLASDFAFRSLDLTGLAYHSLVRQSANTLEMLTGFVAGFNRFLSEPEAANLPCAGQPWLAPITATDLAAYHRSLALLVSGGLLLDTIAAAQPPGAAGIQWFPREAPARKVDPMSLGSNGWALGTQRSAQGRGMLVANPHFPWEGELRLWESHLTVPGKLDVYGASLLGVPGILIGFNSNVAWTHTVSSVGARFTAYALALVPGKPTSYYYDGAEREMTARDITVQVRLPDGSLADVTRTYYSSHYGPIISLPGVGWSEALTLTYRDANLYNEVLLTQYLGMNRASSLEEFQQVFATVQGIPWVNTIAADREGNVWYADGSATPNVSLATLQSWAQALEHPESPQSLLLQYGIVLLNGTSSADEWIPEPGARSPGIIPAARTPQLERKDVVFNSNDSHWLPHPTVTLEGFSPLQGDERTPRSLRTRMNARMLEEVREGGASGADGRFTLEELQAAILSNRSITTELLREAVVQRCQARPSGTAQGQSVDLTQACAVLAAWNGRFDTDRAGPPLWREFIASFGPGARTSAGALFATPFSPEEPIATPHTLRPAASPDSDPVLDQLAAAVLTLQLAGIPLDRPLGQVQFAPRGNQRVPLHGGMEVDGVANVVGYNRTLNSSTEATTPRGPVLSSRTGLTADGYVINSGTSFLMAMEFLEEGVRARALLTYGQEGDSASPEFRDQLPLFSEKQWRDIAFSEEEITADPEYRTLTLTQD